MSSAPKTGICRIPTFSSRIPQIRPQPNAPAPALAPATVEEITAKQLGRRARSGDKEGILRFVGSVQFAKGTWCGLELKAPVGKNDGSVSGVRYFACSARCGLMVPLSKVSLLDDTCDSPSEDESGPYSMLFIDPKHDRTAFGSDDFVNAQAPKNSNFLPRDNKNETYEVFQQDNATANNVKSLEATFKLPRESIDNRLKTIQSETITKSKDTVKDNSKKRTNETFDLPNDKNATISNTINGAHCTTDLNVNLTFQTNENSSQDLVEDSSIEVKRRRTSSSRNHVPETIEKPSSLPQLRSSLESLELNRFTFSTPMRTDSKEPMFRKIRISSINAEPNIINDEESKRDSLELDESLGILTPYITRSPSLEYEININDLFPKERKSSELPSPKDECIFPHQASRTKSVNIDVPLTKEPKHDLPGPNFTRMTDFSLGIIDEQKISNMTMRTNTTMNTEPTHDMPSPNLTSMTDFSLGIIDEQIISNVTMRTNTTMNTEPTHDMPSPNLTSMTDFSLGIIDEQIISNMTMRTNTTINMELPLDSVDKSMLARIEQTPSPEELPLDPTPIIESDPKTEPSKSKTSSFITSITSITSLDTGYQGDGEMSRPASRGADSSPLTRRPLPRPQARRHDPMTDSDFYTESDADNHDENPLRGDRRAQVIDGTLYGVDPQAAADIYANNRENMDSSGVFTDIEGNTRTEEEADVSPSDSSSKTISENSQDNIQDVLEKTLVSKEQESSILKENPKKRNAPSPGVSSPSSISSPRHASKEENITKKYKMPKRDVTSKVKVMLETTREQPEKKCVKKPVGRWDAVMNKISKNEQTVPKKEIKSKVFNNINVNTGVLPRQNEMKKSGIRTMMNQKSQNNKILVSPGLSIDGKSTSCSNLKKTAHDRLNPMLPLDQTTSPVRRPRSAQSLLSSEKRRIRIRPNSGTSVKNVGETNVGSSIHSSLSDLSAATLPPKNTLGSTKKRTDVGQVTQVLTANKLPPKTQKHTAAENKKNATLHSSPSIETKTKRTIFSPKEKKPIAAKECGRGTAKGGRTSPTVRPPSQPRVPSVKQPPVAEALAVLVHHLVFNVQAYQVPTLKKQLEKYRSESEEIRLACQQLEDALAQEKIQHARAIDEERIRCRRDVAELIDKHRIEIAELNKEHLRLEQRLSSDKENAKHNLCKQHEDQLATLKVEFEKLQRTHEESLEILREENESIREQITAKQLEVEKSQTESRKLLEDYESREVHLKGHNRRLREQLDKSDGDFEQRLKGLVDENRRLRDENERLLSYGDDKGISLQEVQSLRAVLELKQNEVAELRKTAAEATQKAEILIGAEERARVLNARCEDLQLQLQLKIDYEKSLVQDNLRLQESFKEEINQKRRLSQHNEELQWKLKQNKEVISKVLEQAEETVFNRSILSSSFNERHSSSRLNLERTLSFRDRAHSNRSSSSHEETVRSRKSKNSSEGDADDTSPPASPKVKGVVDKGDSVSYVLEMDESPEVVANRIVRRSFRNTTPPTRGASSKRPRMRTPLSQSASSGAIVSSNRSEPESPKSGGSRNGDWDQDVFSWPANITSSPKYGDRLDANYESSGGSSNKLDHDDHLDLDEEEEDEDLRLPALPSELKGRRDGVSVLPSPKLLAGEAMVSESNSEDESTSSSQL